ncbi:hypothetical protein Lalb_Chr05g0227081 [Lupinus albus]|uniref:Uncharacterized protein n=1 Tax=Lupinus albus TaxID=3870 RepID=A0A6A4QLF5_LUPAL|nr:hypothetical protein Lalb_Chr05g0227081 [Lupinus albus]
MKKMKEEVNHSFLHINKKKSVLKNYVETKKVNLNIIHYYGNFLLLADSTPGSIPAIVYVSVLRN